MYKINDIDREMQSFKYSENPDWTKMTPNSLTAAQHIMLNSELRFRREHV